jgi:hypothetical protein
MQIKKTIEQVAQTQIDQWSAGPPTNQKIYFLGITF